MNTGPVLLVVDDSDDFEFVQTVWKELKLENPLLFFNSGEAVLKHLQADPTVPFLIISDVNLAGMGGFELKRRIVDDRSLRYKSIPFVFWSTQASEEQIKKSYDLGGNGFFIKEDNLQDLKQSFSRIIAYWLKSKVPAR